MCYSVFIVIFITPLAAWNCRLRFMRSCLCLPVQHSSVRLSASVLNTSLPPQSPQQCQAHSRSLRNTSFAILLTDVLIVNYFDPNVNFLLEHDTGHAEHYFFFFNVNMMCLLRQMGRTVLLKERLLACLDGDWSPNTNKQKLA